ncbi:MAG: monofunctional biosynthetic peptidoglycan transglycosylase [Bacteroidales bacterium]|nr:monofunctional biosynthetic peptidoglycan transglycosylase [Bacteroidales bacterium]
MRAIGKITKFFFIISITSVILLRFVPIKITPLMILRTIQQIFKGDRIKLQQDWINIEKVSPHFIRAVQASEDQKFIKHKGFDFQAMKKVYQLNKKKKLIKGASTISQQVAKNVFLLPIRSYLRKIIEAYFTILIEIFWGKNRILEVYINVIELSNGVYGIEAASQYYYNKPASKLTKYEAASLAAILPNPLKYNPKSKKGYVSKRRSFILKYMSFMPILN